ncbi:MAG: sulfur carrier protein ThiS [Chloroflexi bacterium]|nr:sulfur carrier protein ThiS [Chloroflexota bacterium]
MAITVNGTLREVQTPCSLHAFLVQHDVNPLLVAVEYNGDIVRPERFDEIALQTGDQLEIVHMVGGGA